MAQEILERHPEAVALQPDGYMSVYYGKIDVKINGQIDRDVQTPVLIHGNDKFFAPQIL